MITAMVAAYWLVTQMYVAAGLHARAAAFGFGLGLWLRSLTQ